MEKSDKASRIILACNKQGAVTKVFLDTAGLLENIELPLGLHSIVSPNSLKELGNFWLSIQDKSMAENIQLRLNYKNTEVHFIFSGYALDESILLCGTTHMDATENALQEIMLINNEQANQIRLSEKKAGNIRGNVEKHGMNEALLNDFSSLNNELINNKRELIRKNQKIELLNKELNSVNENMSMLTYSVSHDLKEPVRNVKSLFTIIHQKYAHSLDQKGQSYMNMALEGANRLSDMLSDLLEYHQLANVNITESVDLDKVLLEVKHILQQEIEEKNAQINIADLPTIGGSIAGYRQIFQNLISNALKFISSERTPEITIDMEENDIFYIFSVRDNGIGIAEGKKQEVFKLFKRLNTTDQYEGNGMGLAMVKKSVERMGGEVWLESMEGKGSTFFFTIKKSVVR